MRPDEALPSLVGRRPRLSLGAIIPSSIPDRITTERLVLRPWRPRDATLLKDAVDSSLPELRAWMPWALNEPSTVEELVARIDRFAGQFERDEEWHFGILDPRESIAIGGAGLHRRVGPTAVEIGYWIRTSATGKGFATEAARAMTAAAFGLPWVESVEIRCDVRNSRSARVPRRLGYQHVETIVGDGLTASGESRTGMVWRVDRVQFGG